MSDESKTKLASRRIVAKPADAPADLATRFASVLCWAVLASVAACTTTPSPVVRLDAPTGPYAVGAWALHLVDDRPEANTTDPTDVPFLVLSTRGHVGIDPSFDAFTRAARAEVFVASIEDTEHLDFTDLPALFPIYQRRVPTLTRADLQLGGLPVERVDSLVRAYVVAFFERTFSGTSSPLLEAGTPAGAPEVRVDVY